MRGRKQHSMFSSTESGTMTKLHRRSIFVIIPISNYFLPCVYSYKRVFVSQSNQICFFHQYSLSELIKFFFPLPPPRICVILMLQQPHIQNESWFSVTSAQIDCCSYWAIHLFFFPVNTKGLAWMLLPSSIALFIFCDFCRRYCLSWTHVLVPLIEGII